MRFVWTSFCLLSFGLGLGACSFAPDLSAYPECSPSGYCAPGCTCFEGQVCVPEDPKDRFRPASFCDPRNNCSADILNDPLNCGECGNVCQFDNASAMCDRGVCRMGDCDPGWDNCGEPNNLGCYDSLDTVLNCGDCGIHCENDTPFCEERLCVDQCDEPKLICDGACIDPETSNEHCGQCNRDCTDLLNVHSAACEEGACVIDDCIDGFDSCNQNVMDGCETPLGTLGNCGACGDSCDWMHSEQPGCVDGLCQFDCDEGWEDCDEQGDNGCEAEMGTLAYCTSCEDECDPGGTCTDQGCIAPECISPFADCGNGCVNTWTDSDHCGGCFESCAGDLRCEEGVCGGMGISCPGISSCTIGQEACCISSEGSAYCVAPNACGDMGSVELQCDGADDCEGEQVCCMPEFVGNASAFCTAGCLEDTVLCSRDSQCPNATSCLMDSSGHYMTCQ